MRQAQGWCPVVNLPPIRGQLAYVVAKQEIVDAWERDGESDPKAVFPRVLRALFIHMADPRHNDSTRIEALEAIVSVQAVMLGMVL
jgi:hypothetical protein